MQKKIIASFIAYFKQKFTVCFTLNIKIALKSYYDLSLSNARFVLRILF